jgi:cell division control protein 12
MASVVRLTVIDTPGFGDYVNNRDSWMPIIEFLDDQHESYMLQEQQPRRQDKIDLRVHACLYFIRPTGHTLKPLDIEVMKRLCSRVNLIPVIAKADTLSPADLAKFKQKVRCRDYSALRLAHRPAANELNLLGSQRHRGPEHQDLPAPS